MVGMPAALVEVITAIAVVLSLAAVGIGLVAAVMLLMLAATIGADLWLAAAYALSARGRRASRLHRHLRRSAARRRRERAQTSARPVNTDGS